jgi:hypothetical protein
MARWREESLDDKIDLVESKNAWAAQKHIVMINLSSRV